MQYIPDNSSSNYLVSNDDLSVMDLPQNMNNARQMMSSNYKGRPQVRKSAAGKIPTLIPPLKYIVYNNPQRVYDLLINKGYNVDNNIPSTYQFAKIYVKEQGEPAILDLVKNAHPDKELMLKALGMNRESSFDGGSDKKEEKKETTETKVVEKDTKKEETAKESSGGIKLNTQTVIIALIIVVFFLLINRANK
jgi:hypothetical protein